MCGVVKLHKQLLSRARLNLGNMLFWRCRYHNNVYKVKTYHTISFWQLFMKQAVISLRWSQHENVKNMAIG